jgi:prefoldin subunit 5
MALLDFLKKKEPVEDLSRDTFGEGADFFPPPPGGGPMPEPNISPALKQQMGAQPQLPPPNMNPNQFGSTAPQFGAAPMDAPPQMPPPQQLPPQQQLPPPSMPNINIPPMDNNIPEPPMPPVKDNTTMEHEESKNHVTLMTDDIEQIAETIIDEKFEKLTAKIDNLDTWKKDIDTKITTMTKTVTDMQTRLNETQKSIMNKVSEYNKSITNVDSEIKALTKVFGKIMPTFTSNVKELSRAVGKVKKRPAATTSTSKRGRPKKK